MREKTKPINPSLVAHNKQAHIEQKITTETQNTNKVSQVSQRLILADEKITQLRKRREKLQAQQALLFLKETQKIFNTEFSTDLALKILEKAWKPEGKKRQEQKEPKREREEKTDSSHSFRDSSSASPKQEDSSSLPTHPAC